MERSPSVCLSPFEASLRIPPPSSSSGTRRAQRAVDDEYSNYCASWHEPNVKDAIKWWMEQRSTFPKLSRLALTLLAVPAQSSEAERVFSTMTQLVTSDRASLSKQSCEMEVLSFRWRDILPQALDIDQIDCGDAEVDDSEVIMV